MKSQLLKIARNSGPSSVTSVYQRRCLVISSKSNTRSESLNRNNVLPSRRYCVKHEKHIVKSAFPDMVIPKENVAEFVWKNISRWQNRTAVICGVTGRSYKYAELRDRSAAFGSRLRTVLKLQPGDTVAIAMLNLPEYPIAALGAVEAGLVVTTINPIYTAEEIERQLIGSDAKAIVVSSDVCSTVLEAVSKLPRAIPVVLVSTEAGQSRPDGVISFSEFSDPRGVDYSVLSDHGRTIDDIVFLPYSSGTTGLPKGVELSHKNITTNCTAMTMIGLHEETTDSHQDVFPVVLPLFHIYGLVMIMNTHLALGCKLVTLPKFNPETFLGALAKHKATILFVVPPMVLFMSSHPGVDGRHVDSLRIIMSGAAPLGSSDADRFKLKAPHVNFLQGYGLTETSPGVLLGEKNNTNYASVGKAVANTECKIVSLETGDNLGPNQSGELCVRGPQVMKGYRNNPEATKAILDDNGWLKTGDIAYYDEDRNFYITDRLKELIKVKGFQVPPAELEAVLRSHPDLQDAAVVGIPHPTSGEVPRAFVVRKPGSTVTEKDIQDFVAKKVAVYKHLTGGVTMVDVIPKNASGKILRRDIKAKYCN